jgi:hypothetical protein
MDYEGIIIEESLQDRSVLDAVDILATRVEPVTPQHRTPWLTQWTLHSVRIPEARAAEVAAEISGALDPVHPGSWYADFESDTHHYVIYRDRVFFIDRRSPDQYSEAVHYGVSRGLPEHQADFVRLVE